MIPDLTIIVPTLNEHDNIIPLVERVHAVLDGMNWEIIFVDDDSTDGTLDVLQRLSREDEQVRYIRRVGRRGLSSACLEGMAASSAPFMAVMDGDLQHDEKLLPKMLEALHTGQFDLAIGSRYKENNVDKDWSPKRARLSHIGTWMAHHLLHVRVTDPLSGFFMMTRELFERSVYKVSGKGFKILLDILTSERENVRYMELPFVFRTRHAGKSKLDTLVIWEYALLLFDKTIGKTIPARFFMFVCMGLLGSIVHVGILGLFLNVLSLSFLLGQSVATLATIGVNFMLNNLFTYRDNRLKGMAILRGALFFYMVCSLGVFVNVLIASFLFERHIQWWIAGLLGATIGGIWNYAVSSVVVWPANVKPPETDRV